MAFEFIHQAMQEVNFPYFFYCQPLSESEQERLDAMPQLPPSYVEFLNTFGRVKFFRDLDRDRHHLFVCPPPQEIQFYGGSYMMDVGATDGTTVFFKYSELTVGRESFLYDIALGNPRKNADSFMEWLTMAWWRTRKSYTKKRWDRVLAGPVPFTPEEKRIVEIRRNFAWRQRRPINGMVSVEFSNNSDGWLSHYSIGVKDEHGIRMVGGFWIDVSKVAPGTTEVINVPLRGYWHLITPEIAVLFDKGDPSPESRGDFWEFRKLNEN